MHKPQTGIACPGCPHRAAFVVVKDAVGRGRGRVFCGDAGCAAVGPLHPAATTCPGGEAALLPRYRHMPRTMLRYAIERFEESKRQQFLQSKI